MKYLRTIFVLLVAVIACWKIAAAGYIHVKAYVAQQLLVLAWDKTLQGNQKVKPWSWSDSWPVARMQVPAHNKDLIILAGDSGRNLAFAPGYRLSTVKPGEPGLSMISAHRDTHFSFLKNLQLGEEILITTEQHKTVFYKISLLKVVHQSNVKINTTASEKTLVLITCYPFDSVYPQTEYRYLVYAQQIKES